MSTLQQDRSLHYLLQLHEVSTETIIRSNLFLRRVCLK